MDELRDNIIKLYLTILLRLERGYKDDIESLLDKIFIENHEYNSFYISKLINES